jgi:DNA polymerase-1
VAEPYRVVTPREALAHLGTLSPGNQPVAIDLETYGTPASNALDPVAGHIRLVSYKAPGEEVRVVDLLMGGHTGRMELLVRLSQFPLLAHNALFDLSFFAARDIHPANRVYCTSVLARLTLAGERGPAYGVFNRPSLEGCAKFFLGRQLDKGEQVSDWGRPQLSREQLDYAAADVAILPALFKALCDRIKGQKMEEAARLEMEALPCVVWANVSGMPFDQALWAVPLGRSVARQEELFREIRAEWLTDARLWEIAQSKCKVVGRQVGQRLMGFAADDRADKVLHSPAQLAQFLRMCGLTVRSTNDDALAELDHPLAELVRTWRECATVQKMFGPTWGRGKPKTKTRSDGSTFLFDPPPAVRRGRLYPSIYQIGAETGRMSYSYPNVQQVPAPKKHPLGAAFRRAFKAPEGREMVLADFSQIELRLAAQISGDKAMRQVYADGLDIHTWAARRITGTDTPTDDQRSLAKGLNFGLLYGAGSKRLVSYLRSQFSIRLSEAEGEAAREGWFAAFPGIRQWHRDTGTRLDRAGKGGLSTRTLCGRLRQGIGTWREGESEAPRGAYSEALNSPVQGSGADLMKLAMGNVWKQRHTAPASGWFPVLFCHDELVLEVPSGSGREMVDWLRGQMIAAGASVMRDVPTDASAAVCSAWLKE